MNDKTEKKDTICPYCNKPMSKWIPHMESGWDMEIQYVCFNDECPYYIKGWEWMREQYSQKASYRFRYDPHFLLLRFRVDNADPDGGLCLHYLRLF